MSKDEFEGKPYHPGTGSEGKWTVIGHGYGLGYHAGYLWPQYTFGHYKEGGETITKKEAAEVAARIANSAHAEGYAQAQRDMQKALGLK